MHTAAGAPATPTSFSFNLTYGNATYATNGTVKLDVYRPNYTSGINQQAVADAAAPIGFTDIAGLSFYEQQMLLDYYLGTDDGYVLWDVLRAASKRNNSWFPVRA